MDLHQPEGQTPEAGHEYTDAEHRYACAMHRRARLVAEWKRLGEPLIAEGGATGRALVTHPLIRAIQEADVLCDRLEKSSRAPARRGRPVGATSAPDRADEPPRVKLRAVDSA